MLSLSKIKNKLTNKKTLNSLDLSTFICAVDSVDDLQEKRNKLQELDVKILKQINNIKEYGFCNSSILKELSPLIATGTSLGGLIFIVSNYPTSIPESIITCVALPVIPLIMVFSTYAYMMFSKKKNYHAPNSSEALRIIENLQNSHAQIQTELQSIDKEIRAYYIKAQSPKKENSFENNKNN